ncbi:hypothetical protein FZW96_12945 [Bacillus sp. BGMRC 2118]|nr:hypothetical protein FZW96_12945 [Bacillus sp. BGMRC 2118]
MSEEWDGIPFPDEDTIQKEIQFIISTGMVKSTKFWPFLFNMYRQVGIRHIFHDLSEILFSAFISVIVLGALGVQLFGLLPVHSVNLYTIIFIGSPVTYAVLVFLFFIRKKESPNFEVEMTCKYNFHQLSAFRMLVFSLFSLVVNVVLLYMISLQLDMNLLYSFLLSSTSLFLFAVSFLYVELQMKDGIKRGVAMIGWVLANLILLFGSNEFYYYLLQHVPFYVLAMIMIVSIYLYVNHLKKLLVSPNRKGWV